MGCDIHCFAEYKREGRWRSNKEERFTNDYYNPDQEEDRWNRPQSLTPYGVRNYNTFSVLANVRNGHGFAGVETGKTMPVIAEPRGLPDDVSPCVREESDDWDVDGHSHSYLTLPELEAFDWDQGSEHCGIISERDYRDLPSGERPKEWSGGISGPGIVVINKSEMDDILSGKSPRESGRRYYVKIWWGQTIRSACQVFVEKTIPELREFAEEHEVSAEDVRIVFWFDN